MDLENLRIFRKQLEAELERVDASLGAGLPEGKNANCSHQADVAGMAQERMLSIPLRNLYRDRRAQIIAARARLRDGTYGTCVECKNWIERDRLEAIPFTPLCISCARAAA